MPEIVGIPSVSAMEPESVSVEAVSSVSATFPESAGLSLSAESPSTFAGHEASAYAQCVLFRFEPLTPSVEVLPKDAFDWVYDNSRLDADGNPMKIGKVNDRLLDVVKWLPGAFADSQLSEIVKVFQDFLNEELYTKSGRWSDADTKISLLGKISGILDLRDPDETDRNFLYAYLGLLGFDYSSIQQLLNSDYKTDSFNQIREIARSAPYLFANKSTERGLSTLLSIFGYSISFESLWTDTRYGYATGNFVPETDSMPEGYNPTPHFNVTVDVSRTQTEMTEEATIRLRNTIEKLKPINTVFDGVNFSTDNHSFSQLVVNPETGELENVYPNGLKLTVSDFWTNDFSVMPLPEPSFYFRDSRDGRMYGYKRYGNLFWFTEDLDYGTSVTNPATDISYGEKWDTQSGYGSLYSWDVAVKSVPEGWHLPSVAEYQALLSSIGTDALEKMKTAEFGGTNESGFNLEYDGHRQSNGTYAAVGTNGATFSWTTDGPNPIAWHIANFFGYADANSTEYTTVNAITRSAGLAVRCVRDYPEMESGVFVDSRDGRIYRWKKFGSLYWMVDNLNYGTPVTDPTQTPTAGQKWVYTPDADNLPDGARGGIYPKSLLGSLAPSGWRIPSAADFDNLKTEIKTMTHASDFSNIGTAMKTDSVWNSGTTGTDAVGWHGLPTGYHDADESAFSGLDGSACYWISEPSTEYNNTMYALREQTTTFDSQPAGLHFSFSVRCVRDTKPGNWC